MMLLALATVLPVYQLVSVRCIYHYISLFLIVLTGQHLSIFLLTGMAVARDLLGKNHNVISVIGDGAMTAGQAYEGMNNAGHLRANLIIVLNDNKQVSLPTATLDGPASPVGALSNNALTHLQASTKFRKLRHAAKVKKTLVQVVIAVI